MQKPAWSARRRILGLRTLSMGALVMGAVLGAAPVLAAGQGAARPAPHASEAADGPDLVVEEDAVHVRPTMANIARTGAEHRAAIEARDEDDHKRMLVRLAKGSMGACLTYALPVLIVPGAKDVFDWACLVPAAFSVDHYSTQQAGRVGHVWPAAGGLVLGNLFEDAVVTPALIVGGVAVSTYAAGGTAALLATDSTWLWPSVTAGGVVVAGVSYLGLRWARARGSEWIATQTMWHLSSPLAGDALKDAQSSTWIPRQVDGAARPYVLFAAADASRPRPVWSDAIPVVGPWTRAPHAAADMVERVSEAGTIVLGDKDRDLTALEARATQLAYTEAGFLSLAHAGLLTGGGFAVAGVVTGSMALRAQDAGEDATALIETTTTLGTIGAGAAIVGVGALLAREVPERLRPLLLAHAYGWDADTGAE